MEREAGVSPPQAPAPAKSSGRASTGEGPSRHKPAGVMKRLHAPPRGLSQEFREDLIPPWRVPQDTDTSSHLGRSSGSRAPVPPGKTAMRSSGSTPQRLSSEEEGEDNDEFDDEDMEEDEEMEGYEEEDDMQAKEPQRVKLDRHGVPVGAHEPIVFRELLKFARQLDPTARPGWHGQQKTTKKALIERVRTEFQFYGETTELSEKWFNKKMSRSVTRLKYQINKLIKEGAARPADIAKRYWEKLVEMQEDPTVQEKSQHMSSISLGRPSKSGNAWNQSLEAVSTLVSSLTHSLERLEMCSTHT